MGMVRKKKNKSGTVKVTPGKGIVYLGRRSTISVVFLIVSLVMEGKVNPKTRKQLVPMIWYRLAPTTSYALEDVLQRPVTSFEEDLVAAGKKTIYQPPQDPKLSEENKIIIKKIGLDTEIVEEDVENYEAAFRKGVWRVPDFGTSFDREKPMILAAHRFGYLAWTNSYRRQNSFFNLPKLEEGDEIEVIWDQRKYRYEVYEGEEAEEISQYAADLILYTCKFLESDVRVFRYARLVQ